MQLSRGWAAEKQWLLRTLQPRQAGDDEEVGDDDGARDVGEGNPDPHLAVVEVALVQQQVADADAWDGAGRLPAGSPAAACKSRASAQ